MPFNETASKNQTAILRALADAHQKSVAERLDTSESAISRMKGQGGLIETAATLLAALDLKVVPSDECSYHPDLIQALHTLAKLGLDLSPESVQLKK